MASRHSIGRGPESERAQEGSPEEPFLVTVLIQSYNYEQYVEAAINSVLEQSYRRFELVIIDDGSTDRSPDIIQGIGDQHPSRITYINRRENKGIVSTYNEAIPYVNGDVFVAISSDDLLPRDALLKRVD